MKRPGTRSWSVAWFDRTPGGGTVNRAEGGGGQVHRETGPPTPRPPRCTECHSWHERGAC